MKGNVSLGVSAVGTTWDTAPSPNNFTGQQEGWEIVIEPGRVGHITSPVLSTQSRDVNKVSKSMVLQEEIVIQCSTWSPVIIIRIEMRIQ